MTKPITYVPTTLCLLAGLGVLWTALEPSGEANIYVWSHFRFGAILVVLAACVYLAFSLRSEKAVVFNNWALYILIGTLAVAEAGLRIMPSIVPTPLIKFLPLDARADLAAERGFFTDAILEGEGLLYRFKPHQPLPAFPWARIDARGFRNPSDRLEDLDVVVLGDSIAIALQAEQDFADRFRSAGLRAVSLAQGGYGPFQYRDAYRRYIVENGIRHRALVVIITAVNDFSNALQYARLGEAAHYRDYLGGQTLPGLNVRSRYFPWVIALAINSLPAVKTMLIGDRLSEATIKLPYGQYSAGGEFLRWEPVSAGQPIWTSFAAAMDDLLELAARQGVPTVVAYHPAPIEVYGAFMADAGERKARLAEDRMRQLDLLAKFFARPMVRFIDLTELEREAVAKEDIAILPLDTHLNTVGVKLIAERLAAELANLGVTPLGPEQ